MKGLIGLCLIATCISAVMSQFPPRLSIPGAIPIGGGGAQQQFRNERVVPSPNIVRIRRPLVRPQSINSLPIQQTRIAPIEEAKPVTEESGEEDAPEPFVPQIISSPPSLPSPPQSLFTNEPSNYESDEALHQQHQPQPQQPQQAPPRFQPQERPAPQRVQQDRFVPVEIPSGAQRFSTNSQPNKAPVRRPVFREPQQQQQQQQQVRPQQHQQYQEEQVRQAPRPTQQRPTHGHDEERVRKPVAQILRKYREENEDGSITWGFENDDGSFKEEVIGIDCVTRGRYGYVDPDGLKREYNYETGILCDPNKRGQEEDDEETKGFVDYQENKAVLPNGVRIDLSQMGKNKSKRPSQSQQQQPQQQQYYRN